MSYAEAPEKTLVRIAEDRNWLNQPLKVLSRDLQTCGNESNREWDSFYYEERENRLFDPVRNGFIDKTDGNDQAQKNANMELQDWFLSHDSGIAVRISPSGGKYNYPDEQIEIYRITYNFPTPAYPTLEKKLFCSFHQFGTRFRNPEQMRRFVFAEADKEESIFEIINWIETISQQKIQTQNNIDGAKNDQYSYYAERLKSGENPAIIFKQMKTSGLIGSNPIGCPPSNNILSNGNIIEAKWCEKCPVCKREVKKFICKGYKCECGAVKEC